MLRKIKVTVFLEVECCDDHGNTDEEIEPTKEQVTEFVLGAIGYYDNGGYEADPLRPVGCSNLLVRNWDAV